MKELGEGERGPRGQSAATSPGTFPPLGDCGVSAQRWGFQRRGGGSGGGSSEPRERQKHVGQGGWEDADGGVTGGSVKEEGVEGC